MYSGNQHSNFSGGPPSVPPAYHQQQQHYHQQHSQITPGMSTMIDQSMMSPQQQQQMNMRQQPQMIPSDQHSVNSAISGVYAVNESLQQQQANQQSQQTQFMHSQTSSSSMVMVSNNPLDQQQGPVKFQKSPANMAMSMDYQNSPASQAQFSNNTNVVGQGHGQSGPAMHQQIQKPASVPPSVSASGQEVIQNQTNTNSQIQHHQPQVSETHVQRSDTSSTSAYDSLFQNLESHATTKLCTLAKDLTREIVNQSVDFFKIMKQLQLPVPHPQIAVTVKQHLDRQERIQKYILVLFSRLYQTVHIIDRRFLEQIPKNIKPEQLIAFEDEESDILSEISSKRKEDQELKVLENEKQTLANILSQKRHDLEKTQIFLNKVCRFSAHSCK